MRFLVLTAIATLTFSGLTHARAEDADKARAKKLYAQGRNLFDQKKYQAAIRKFKQARQHWKHRSLLFNIAAAYAYLNRPVAAVTYLRLYLQHARLAERTVPPFLKKMQRQVGVLVVQVLDRNAAIWIDGRFRGYARVELVLRPGNRRVSVRLGGREVAHRSIRVLAGREHLWEVSDIPVPSVRPRPEPRRLRPALALPRPGRRRPEGVTPPRKEPAPKRTRRTIWRALFGSTIGAGGIFLVASIMTAFRVKKERDRQQSLIDLTQLQPNPVDPDAPDPCLDAGSKGYDEIVDVCNRVQRYETTTWALVGTGLVLVAISMGFVYHAFIMRPMAADGAGDSNHPRRPFPVTITPTFGRDSAALSVSLDF